MRREWTWRIEWRGRPQADGLERLGQAMRLLVDRAQGPLPLGQSGVARMQPAAPEQAEEEHV
jgi:hypothetical protein